MRNSSLFLGCLTVVLLHATAVPILPQVAEEVTHAGAKAADRGPIRRLHERLQELDRRLQIWEGIRQRYDWTMPIRDVLGEMAARAPAAGEAVYSALTEIVGGWTAAAARYGDRQPPAAEFPAADRQAEGLGQRAATTGYQTPEEARRSAALLEQRL